MACAISCTSKADKEADELPVLPAFHSCTDEVKQLFGADESRQIRAIERLAGCDGMLTSLALSVYAIHGNTEFRGRSANVRRAMGGMDAILITLSQSQDEYDRLVLVYALPSGDAPLFLHFLRDPSIDVRDTYRSKLANGHVWLLQLAMVSKKYTLQPEEYGKYFTRGKRWTPKRRNLKEILELEAQMYRQLKKMHELEEWQDKIHTN
jgi:hypothetical protein